jgi:hypothetical protein
MERDVGEDGDARPVLLGGFAASVILDEQDQLSGALVPRKLRKVAENKGLPTTLASLTRSANQQLVEGSPYRAAPRTRNYMVDGAFLPMEAEHAVSA